MNSEEKIKKIIELVSEQSFFVLCTQERGYIILSLVAKSLLAWLVFAGTLQPA